MKTKILLGCGLPLLFIGALIFFGAKSLKTQPTPERSETVDRGDVEIKVVENGDIETLHKVEVKSKAGGRVVKLLVDEGAVVHVGQKLAIIDPQEVNSQVAAYESQIAGAKARLASAHKNATYQKSQTHTNIDQYVQALEAARARLRSAEAESNIQPEMTQQSIAMAESNLEASRASLKALEDNLALMIESTHPQNVVNAQTDYDRTKAQNANAIRNVHRQQQLLDKGFVSQSVVDVAVTDQLVTDAAMKQAKQRLDQIGKTNQLEEANARSQIASAKSQVQQQIAALAQAKATVLPLTKKQELAAARAAVAQAEAQLVAARAGKTQDAMRGDDIHASEAEVQQLQNQLSEVKVRQQDATIFATMDGIVTKRYVEEGEIITSAVSSFSSGTPIFQIADPTQMLVKININEVDITKVKVGMTVDVTSDSARGAIFPGRVRKVSPSAMAGANDQAATSSNGRNNQSVIRFAVEVQIDKSDPRLKPGMSARCAVIVARHKNVLRVPLDCVTGEGDKGKVSIVTSTQKDGKPVETTTPRDVKIGIRGGDFAEIIEGVKQGEKVRPNPFSGPPRKTMEIQMGG